MRNRSLNEKIGIYIIIIECIVLLTLWIAIGSLELNELIEEIKKFAPIGYKHLYYLEYIL